MKKILIAFLILLMVVSFISITSPDYRANVASQSIHLSPYSTGTSTIILNQTTITVEKGTSYNITYTVKLTSGKTWGTSVSSSQPSGISVCTSTGLQDPNFSGTATINPSTSMAKGTYTVNFSALGDDPTTSPSTLTVKVINATSSGSPTPPPSKTPTPAATNNNPFIFGSLVIIIFLISLIVTSITFGKIASSTNVASSFIALSSSVYLLTYDSVLMQSAYYHWLGLLAYVILAIVTLVVAHTATKLSRIGYIGLGAGSLLMAILMLSDVFIGLPYSSSFNLESNIGWNYLFGFGITSISNLSTSLAFSILLISTGIVSGTSFQLFRKHVKK